MGWFALPKSEVAHDFDERLSLHSTWTPSRLVSLVKSYSSQVEKHFFKVDLSEETRVMGFPTFQRLQKSFSSHPL